MYTYILVDSLDDDVQFYTPFSLFLFSHANLINSIEWPAKQFPRLRRNPVAVISIPFNFRGIQLDNPFRFLFEINTLPPSPPRSFIIHNIPPRENPHGERVGRIITSYDVITNTLTVRVNRYRFESSIVLGSGELVRSLIFDIFRQ